MRGCSARRHIGNVKDEPLLIQKATLSGMSVFIIHMPWRPGWENMNSMPLFSSIDCLNISPRERVASVCAISTVSKWPDTLS